MNFDEIRQIVNECLRELLAKDFLLLRYDVSERSITHKLAEYLQIRFPKLNVDCEYNRNVEEGEFASKQLYILKDIRDGVIKTDIQGSKAEEDLLAVSTYPDIIVHRRTKNNENLLVIEVKKKNSKVRYDFDHQKLRAFTDKSENNP
ncbi:MAG: hypothetical protein WBW94_03315, partial [Anaerolineales bacterium]